METGKLMSSTRATLRAARGAMLRAAQVTALFSILCASLCSCTARTRGAVGILEGSLAWARKDWAGAVSAFLSTASEADASGNTALRDYAVYGLASSYLSQEEFDSALERLSLLGDSAPPAIRAGMWYQAGIIAYRRGAYEEAASFFKRSLESDSTAIDAKVNLELTRRVITESRDNRSSGAAGMRDSPESGGEGESIFNLVRKKEQDIWKNQEDGEQTSKVADY
ncbi:MAG TPA: tetratricopeptide repeat protein [Treponemataceae bacterium]|nr:tetratricopeptide repeat protein [Treponemataceae bacterium]